MTESVNELMNHEPVYRTAPATLGLLKNVTYDMRREVNILSQFQLHPILDTTQTLFVILRVPPLDSETEWTGELWSKTNILDWQN